MNLLIGDNASGKTSLIRACNLFANAFFCGYSDENTVWKNAEDHDFRYFVEDSTQLMLYEESIHLSFHMEPMDLLAITLPDGSQVSVDEDETLYVEKRSKNNSRNLLEGLKPLRDYGASLLSSSQFENDPGRVEQRNALPVYACFTTEDIHSSRKLKLSRF